MARRADADVELRRGDAGARDRLRGDLDVAQPERLDRLADARERKSEMEQRADRHVAADAGEGIEDRDPHIVTSKFRLHTGRGGGRACVCAELAMRRRELNTFRKLLHERRHELLAEALRTVDGMGET